MITVTAIASNEYNQEMKRTSPVVRYTYSDGKVTDVYVVGAPSEEIAREWARKAPSLKQPASACIRVIGGVPTPSGIRFPHRSR